MTEGVTSASASVQPGLQASDVSIEPSAGVIRWTPREYAIRQTMEPVNTIFSVCTVRLRTHNQNREKAKDDMGNSLLGVVFPVPRILSVARVLACCRRRIDTASGSLYFAAGRPVLVLCDRDFLQKRGVQAS